MIFTEIHTKPFLNDVKTVKKDKVLIERLHNKINEILKSPEHYPLKKYVLKGKRSAHVSSYVILFEIIENKVIFHRFKHHDFAYD